MLCAPPLGWREGGGKVWPGHAANIPALTVKVGIRATIKARLSVVARREPNAAYVRIMFMSKLHIEVGTRQGVDLVCWVLDTCVMPLSVNTVLANRLCKSA
jgi:hypothetical protein